MDLVLEGVKLSQNTQRIVLPWSDVDRKQIKAVGADSNEVDKASDEKDSVQDENDDVPDVKVKVPNPAVKQEKSPNVGEAGKSVQLVKKAKKPAVVVAEGKSSEK